jgi:hypothetical protein
MRFDLVAEAGLAGLNKYDRPVSMRILDMKFSFKWLFDFAPTPNGQVQTHIHQVRNPRDIMNVHQHRHQPENNNKL